MSYLNCVTFHQMFAVPILSADVKLMTRLDKPSTTCKRSCRTLLWLVDLCTQWCKIVVLSENPSVFCCPAPPITTQWKGQILSYGLLGQKWQAGVNRATPLEGLWFPQHEVAQAAVPAPPTPSSTMLGLGKECAWRPGSSLELLATDMSKQTQGCSE